MYHRMRWLLHLGQESRKVEDTTKYGQSSITIVAAQVTMHLILWKRPVDERNSACHSANLRQHVLGMFQHQFSTTFVKAAQT
jgi:hypothetical protein